MPHSNDSVVLDNYMRVRVLNLKCILKCVWWSVVGRAVGGVQPTAAGAVLASHKPSLTNTLIRY